MATAPCCTQLLAGALRFHGLEHQNGPVPEREGDPLEGVQAHGVQPMLEPGHATVVALTPQHDVKVLLGYPAGFSQPQKLLAHPLGKRFCHARCN